MLDSSPNKTVTVLDVSQLSYAERVCAAALQGLVNRQQPALFLDYGIYDDPLARRTNEVFMDDETWFGKYRALLGAQDQRNLAYYQQKFDLAVEQAQGLTELVSTHAAEISGLVVWDESLTDTVNIAVMLSAQENLLPVSAELAARLAGTGLTVRHDLRGRWPDRVSLYNWAFENLFSGCKPGLLACIEPDWQRPEFIDYIVQQKIFVYSLSATAGGFGSQLLLLLAFGPPRLRELLFAARLDGFIRKLSLVWMGWKNSEVRLSNRIQKAVKEQPYPTIFGWHTRRDDELSFMLQLSANGMRLVPSHLAANFSFHSQLPSDGARQPQLKATPVLDPDGVYLTFTLSDGDQLMMMSTGELGSWYSSLRGSVPFNWETQPLLVELAPALLEKYIATATVNDCLIAGPSGAGYIVPPLAPRLDRYMDDTARVCAQSGINVVTTYVADPPARILDVLARHSGGLTGFLAGYAVVNRAPIRLLRGTPLVANSIPTVAQIWLKAEDLLSEVRQEISRATARPRFIGVHLFAYRTTYEDVAKFVASLDEEHVHVVRGDEFLLLAREHLQETLNKGDKHE